MTRFDISWEDNYIGVWIGEPSRELRIRKVRPRRYRATLLIGGRPVNRPWMNGEPTVDMPATYSFTALGGPVFAVDLWSHRRFEIDLDYRPDYYLCDNPPCEALVMGISRDAELGFLDQYYRLLGGAGHLVRFGSNEA